MVLDIFLMVIIIALLSYVYLKDKQHNNQINRLINAVISKTPQDLTNLTLAEKTRVDLENKPPLGPISDDYVPIGGADNESFDLMIEKQLNPDIDE